MALKPDRNISVDETSYFAYSVSERGGVMCSTTGTQPIGAARDSSRRQVFYVTNPSGRSPVGLLVHDVVNIDQSRQQLNPYKSEVQIGSKVPLVVRGSVTTNFISNNQASGLLCPQPAYLGPSGMLYSSAGFAGSGWPQVGRFMTNVDADGYAEVDINIR